MRYQKKPEPKIDIYDVKRAITEAGGEIWFPISKIEDMLIRVKIGDRKVKILVEGTIANLMATALGDDENAPVHRVKSIAGLQKFIKKFQSE